MFGMGGSGGPPPNQNPFRGHGKRKSGEGSAPPTPTKESKKTDEQQSVGEQRHVEGLVDEDVEMRSAESLDVLDRIDNVSNQSRAQGEQVESRFSLNEARIKRMEDQMEQFLRNVKELLSRMAAQENRLNNLEVTLMEKINEICAGLENCDILKQQTELVQQFHAELLQKNQNQIKTLAESISMLYQKNIVLERNQLELERQRAQGNPPSEEEDLDRTSSTEGPDSPPRYPENDDDWYVGEDDY